MMTRRRSQVAAAGLLGLVAAAWVAGGLMRLQVGTGVDSFLPGRDDAVLSIDTLARSFGGDPIVVLLQSSEDNELLGPEQLPRLLALEGELAGLRDVAVVYGPATTLNQTVIRIQQFLAELSGRRDALKEAGRREALEAFDKRYGALVIKGLPGGLPTLRNSRFVTQVLYGQEGQIAPRWRQFVPNARAAAIFIRPRQSLDQDAAQELTANVKRAVSKVGLDKFTVTVTGAPVVTAELAHQASDELPRLGLLAAGAVSLVLVLVPWTSGRARRLVPLAPMMLATLMTLAWFGWRGHAVSLGAVAFLPVILGLGTYYPVYLSRSRHLRLILAVGASAAAAFASLALSSLPFVQDLGEAIAVGVSLAIVVTLAMRRLGGLAAMPESAALHVRSDRGGSSLGLRAALATGVVLAGTGWALLPQIEIQTDPQRLIAGLDAFDSADRVEGVLGFSGELDIVLTGDNVLTPGALAWLRDAEAAIVTRYGDEVRPIASPGQLLSFLGDRPTQAQIDAAMRLLPSYISGAAVSPDGRQALISLGGNWADLAGREGLADEIGDVIPAPPPGYAVSTAGLPVAAQHGYDLVSDSRYWANFAGIAAAIFMLVIVLPRKKDAGLALVAAMMATGLGMLLAAGLGIALNPLTLALGPLAAAVGCEFTVLLVASRRDGDVTLRSSVVLALCLSSVGYGVLAFSGLLVVREFGFALLVSVALAFGCAALVSRMVAPAGPPSQSRRPHRVLEEVGVS